MNAKTAGIDWTRSCWAICGASSMFSLTNRTAPPVSATTFSRIGVNCLQGPHQGAQKSTMIGTSRLASRTSAAKVASDVSMTVAPAAPSAGPPTLNCSIELNLVISFETVAR